MTILDDRTVMWCRSEGGILVDNTKQTKISYWLKGVVILLGIIGIVFFGGFTWYASCMRAENPGSLRWTFVFFMWFTAILCYVILFCFWGICTQIGRDNSFSLENAKHFRQMAVCGVIASVGFVARMLWMAVLGELTPLYAVIIAGEVLLGGVFAVLCAALSMLVKNAYEVKLENELTI